MTPEGTMPISFYIENMFYGFLFIGVMCAIFLAIMRAWQNVEGLADERHNRKGARAYQEIAAIERRHAMRQNSYWVATGKGGGPYDREVYDCFKQLQATGDWRAMNRYYQELHDEEKAEKDAWHRKNEWYNKR